MKNNFFDVYIDNYQKVTQKNLNFFSKSRNFFYECKIEIIKKKIFFPEKILDFGSGIGLGTKLFLKYFPKSKIFAFDVSKKSLNFLKKKNPNINVKRDAVFKNCYDLITVFGVFHHIPQRERSKNLKLLFKLLKKNGKIFIFEHNPYNPITRYIVNNCPYDKGVKLIYLNEFIELSQKNNYQIIDKGYCLIFPEFLGFLRKFENLVKWLPFGGQYYLELSKKESEN